MKKGKILSFQTGYFFYHMTLPVIVEGNKIFTSLDVKDEKFEQ